jgi:hypothetical protein
LALTIALIFLVTVSLEGKLRVDSEWGGGFYATINIPVTRNVTDDEWELEVRFDQPVTIDVSNMSPFSVLFQEHDAIHFNASLLGTCRQFEIESWQFPLHIQE